MTSIYGRLGFNSNDPITNATVSNYNSNVQTQMAMVPPLLKPWQANAVGSGTVTGFFQNPVANITQSIWNVSNTLIILTRNLTSSVSGTITTQIANINTNASLISTSSVNTYIYITNRQSNIVPTDSDNLTPHYQTAISQSKALSYLVNQTDGIQNNSVIMGNFTSITLGNTLTSLYNTMNTVTNILKTTITYGGFPTYSNTTSIDAANASLLTNSVYEINQLMTLYPAQDKQFFQNSANVLNDFSSVTEFNSLGQSQMYLINNYIGTSSLISNLNS